MKALSIWQPWASLIAVGAKHYETRGWQPPRKMIGQRVAIQAARSLHGFAIADGDPQLTSIVQRVCGCTPRQLPIGVIVATAMVYDVRRAEDLTDNAKLGLCIDDTERHLGDYTAGRFGWRLTSIRRLTNPVKCMGKQCLFDLPDDVAVAVVADLQHDPNLGNWGDSHGG